jgi:hypothetical protein
VSVQITVHSAGGKGFITAMAFPNFWNTDHVEVPPDQQELKFPEKEIALSKRRLARCSIVCPIKHPIEYQCSQESYQPVVSQEPLHGPHSGGVILHVSEYIPKAHNHVGRSVLN